MRRRSLLAAPLVAAVVLAGCQGEDPYVAPTPTASVGTPEPAAAATTLETLERALRKGDADAAAALGADARASEQLSTAAGNVRRLRLDDLSLRYLSETGPVAQDGGWVGVVELVWRLRGFDRVAARGEIRVEFPAGGDEIAGVGGGGLLPLWLSGPVTVRRGPGTLVLAQGSVTDAERLAAQATLGLQQADLVLGGNHRVVVEVPGSSASLHEAIGQDPGTFDDVAAVTTSADGSLVPGSPVHVFVNPAVYDDLGDVEAQVVMTHEVVHAVTDAPLAATAPLWLLEGFADYVALRDVELPVSTTAGQIVRQVRRDGLPRALPGPAEFENSGTHLGAAYEAAWIACVVLAERGGEEALVGLYDAVLDGADLDQQLQSRFGWSVGQLTGAWRARLAALADLTE